MDINYKYNLGLFLTNFFIICALTYDFLTRHILHQNPILFLAMFGIFGSLISIYFTRIKIFIPLKTLLVNILSACISFLIFFLIYDDCIGIGCDRSIYDFFIIMVYLFIILKLHISTLVITIIYLLLRKFTHK